MSRFSIQCAVGSNQCLGKVRIHVFEIDFEEESHSKPLRSGEIIGEISTDPYRGGRMICFECWDIIFKELGSN